jgi:hypothetical protein
MVITSLLMLWRDGLLWVHGFIIKFNYFLPVYPGMSTVWLSNLTVQTAWKACAIN